MISSFTEKNSVNYLKSFSDQVLFEANPDARTKYSSYFLSWDKNDEERYFINVVNHLKKSTSITLTFDNFPDSQGDSSLVQTDYEIIVSLVDFTDTKKFFGQMQIQLVRDQSGYWSIKSWADVISHPDSTWSDLKGLASTW